MYPIVRLTVPLALTIVAAVFARMSAPEARAMEYTLIREPGIEYGDVTFPDIIAIYATGEIREGDAGRLAAIMPEASRDQYGNVRLYLDSPGGSVTEAKAMVEVMDEYEVTAIVNGRSKCLSACASVLFLSARIHFMLEGAEIGFHTCRGANAVVNTVCNDLLSGDLVYRGTDFGATSSFLKMGTEGPDDMIYLDWRSATVWGLIGPPTYDPTLARPSFECDGPATPLKITTCGDLRLARYEGSLSRSHLHLTRITKKSAKASSQAYANELVRIEKACGGSAGCLLREYATARKSLRLSILATQLSSLLPQIGRAEDRALIEARFGNCLDASECDRPALLDASFEFAQGNFAMLYAMLVLASQKQESAVSGYSDRRTGTSDCVITDLCDPAIRTFNWLLLSAVAEKKTSSDVIARYVEELRASLPLSEIQFR